MSIVRGGAPVAGVAIGMVMLDARFPRVPGDVGHAASWPFPVHFKPVPGATPDHVVRHRAEGLLDDFIAAGRELVAMGVAGIVTNCGFLSLYQQELAAALPVPVMTSSLMQVGMLNALLPAGKRAGILSIAGSSLTSAHLESASVPPGTPIGSTEGGREFTRAILGNEDALDTALARQDNIDAARALQAEHPDLGAIVLECTNMAPYAAAIHAATGLPVYSMVDFVCWFQAGLRPRTFPDP